MTPRSFSSILDLLSKSRFASVSLLLHVVLLVFGGSMVLFHAAPPSESFTASDAYGGLVGEESGEAMAPPDFVDLAPADTAIDIMTPSVEAPAVTDVLTSANLTSTFAMPALPSSVTMDSSRFAQGMAKKLSGGDEKRGLGSLGRTLRTSRIFGKEVTAAKLGVLMDMSGSTHKYIDVVVKEVQKSFADAEIVLTPGCGMRKRARDRVITGKEFKDELRKVDRQLNKTGNEAGLNSFYFMKRLLSTNKEFSKLFDRGVRKGQMSVQVHDGKMEAKVIWGTHASFFYLIKQEVDTIYWFADFIDEIEDGVAEDVVRKLRAKKVVVHQHVFDNPKPNKKYLVFAQKTKGQVIVKGGVPEKGKKK